MAIQFLASLPSSPMCILIEVLEMGHNVLQAGGSGLAAPILAGPFFAT